MKDFFILVKALLAANVKVTPAKKQKNKKSPNYLRSLILSMIIGFLSANAYIIPVSVFKYVTIDSLEVNYALKQETLSKFFLTALSIFLIAYILMVTMQAYSTFFPKENEFILFLPIEGRKLFFARYFISSIISLGLIGPSLIAHTICYLFFTSASAISYILSITFILSFFAVAPLLGYLILLFSIRFFKLFEKKRNKIIFFIVLNTLGISLYSSFYAICYIPMTTYEHFQILFSITKYLFWVGYLPKLFFDLDSYWYILVFIAFILIFIGIFFLALRVSDKYYSLYLSTNEKSKSKNKKKDFNKVNDEFIKEKLKNTDNTLKSYLKREKGNIKSYPAYYIFQTLGAIFAVALFSFLSFGINTILNNVIEIEADLLYLNLIKNISLLVTTVLISFAASANSLIFISVSVEKKNFYMLKTFPIDRKNYYLSKFITSSIIQYPFIIISCIFVSIINRFNPLEAIGIILYSSSIFVISQLVYSIFGFLNPNFNLTLGLTNNQTVAAKGSFKYSLYQSAISLLGDEPVNLLIISGVLFIIFKIPVVIMIYSLLLVNGLIIFFMSKLTMKSLDFAFSKEFNI